MLPIYETRHYDGWLRMNISEFMCYMNDQLYLYAWSLEKINSSTKILLIRLRLKLKCTPNQHFFDAISAVADILSWF